MPIERLILFLDDKIFTRGLGVPFSVILMLMLTFMVKLTP